MSWCVLPPQVVAVWGSSVVVFEPKLTELVLEDTDTTVSVVHVWTCVPYCCNMAHICVCVLCRSEQPVLVHCNTELIGVTSNIVSYPTRCHEFALIAIMPCTLLVLCFIAWLSLWVAECGCVCIGCHSSLCQVELWWWVCTYVQNTCICARAFSH